jgi:transcriptional regulator with XRE-family HTH domain
VSTPELKSAFGKFVRRRRLAAGLTQGGLAHRSGSTATFISLVEDGHKAASIVSIHRLATGLGVKASVLIAEWERKCGG